MYPFASEIIMPFAGYLVFTGVLNIHLAPLAGAFGCAVGSAVAYYAGKVLGENWNSIRGYFHGVDVVIGIWRMAAPSFEARALNSRKLLFIPVDPL